MHIKIFDRFWNDRRGTVAVLIAVAIIPLIGAIGIATDTARGFMVKSRLSSAIDAAALAGARVFFQDRRDSDIEDFFAANFPPGFMNAAVDGPTIVADEDAQKLTVTARATVPTTFMRLLGQETMTVSAFAEVTRETKPLDVVLAIDMSGSMTNNLNGQSRLAHAKAAALKLVEILYGDNPDNNLLKIGVVPWAGAVNVTLNGTTFGYDASGNPLSDADRVTEQLVTNFVNPYPDYNLEHRPWDPYKTYKAVHADENQTMVWFAHNSPVPLLSNPVFNPATSDPVEVWSGCVWARWDVKLPPADNADTTRGIIAEWPGWEPMGPDTLPVTNGPGPGPAGNKCVATQYSPQNVECTPCPASGILPMSRQRSVVEAAIEDLTIPNPPSGTDYYTNIPQGLAWAWRAVHPEPPFTEGADFVPGFEPERAIVLLTDGQNTWRAGDAYNGFLPNQNQRNTWTREIATNIKGEDILIYTIQFANGSGSLAQLMKDVATEPGAPYYYNAPSEDELEEAFKEVANHLSNLRLSK